MKDDDHITPETQAQAHASEGLLARWSRRKLEVAGTGESAPEAAEEQGVTADVTADVTESAPDLTDADMPPIESLTEDSDYSVFLSPRVSETLRQQALERLFRMSQFNLCDGLDDYAEDFTQFAGLGDIVTHEMQYLIDKQKDKLTEALQHAGQQSSPEDQEITAEHGERSGQDPDLESNRTVDANQQSGDSGAPDEPEEHSPS